MDWVENMKNKKNAYRTPKTLNIPNRRMRVRSSKHNRTNKIDKVRQILSFFLNF